MRRLFDEFLAGRYSTARIFRSRIFAAACAVCGRQRPALCIECLPAVRQRRVVSVLERDRPTIALGPYRNNFAAAILAFKDGRRDVGDALIDAMALRCRTSLGDDASAALAAGDLALIGVPTIGSRRRARGFDGGEFLAHGIARAWRIPARRCLRRVLADAQRGRSRAERLAAQNLFALRRLPPEQCALLVDDVVTTGATLRDIARVLRENGIYVLGALAAAYVP